MPNEARIEVPRTVAVCVILAWTVLAFQPARAQAIDSEAIDSEAAEPEEQEVRLYTNADLERFEVLPGSSVQADRPSPEEMQRVAAYIRESYDRIEARQSMELGRRRARAEIDAIETESRRSRAYLPFNYFWYGDRGGVPDYDHGSVGLGHLYGKHRLPATGGAIRPLHARPTLSQVQWQRATRRSGVAAFPSNSRGRSSSSRGRGKH